jgi:hypothetical protein
VKFFLQYAQQMCYPLFALIATVECPAVFRRSSSRAGWRVLVVFALLLGLAFYGLAATDARADTRSWDMAEVDPLDGGPGPSHLFPEDGGQQATTDQAAAAAAAATQQQPTNVVVTVRINSPGDDGPINQTNVVVADADGSNSASTAQNGNPTAGGATPDQNAATGQEAGATATASQDGAGNLVVIVRINSPGDNGAISQTNAAGAGANAANTSATSQGQPAAVTEPPASASGVAPAPRRPARKPAAHPPRKERAAARPVPRPPAPPATPLSQHQSAAAPAVDRTHPSNPASAQAHKQAKRAPARSVDRGGAASALHRVAAGAADVLDAVAPPAPVARTDSADVSRPVVFSLLAVLAAVAAFLFWPQRPEWLRRIQPRTRLRG